MTSFLQRLAAPVAVVASLILAGGVAAAPTIQNLQTRQGDLQQKIVTTRRQAQQLRRQEQVAKSALGSIRQNLVATTSKLQDTRFQLSVAQQRLLFLSRDLTRLQSEFTLQQRTTRARLRLLQRQRPDQWWALLLASRDLNQMMDRRYQMGLVFGRDQRMLIALEDRRRQVVRKRAAVENQKNDIALIAQQLATRRSQVAQQASIQTDLVQRLTSQRAAFDAAERRLASDSRRISGLIRSIIARQKAALARQRAAAAAQNRQTQSQQTEMVIVQGSGRMSMPTVGRYSSAFGMRSHPIFRVRKMHTGVDIAAPSGTPIRAADDGTVIFAGWYGGYGRCIVISHGGTLSTLYGHASRLYVSAGQAVQKGQVVAGVGSTGFSTGPHLHFEVRVDGVPVDPMPYLR